MDQRFNDIQQLPENSIFDIVFYPDRIYHAAYLNATRSPRYRYYVHQVRTQVDTTVLTGHVFFDGVLFASFMRFEYRASRLVELVREKNRFLQQTVLANVTLHHKDGSRNGAGWIRMHFDPWINAYQAEIWDTLTAPLTKEHDIKVVNMMGREGSITRLRAFDRALADVYNLQQIEISMRESDVDDPLGFKILDFQTDNDYGRTYQVPNSRVPSDQGNTVAVNSYLLDFQRGWFVQKVRDDIAPVRYKNAMTEPTSADYNKPGPNDNIIEMRWVMQRQLGGTIVYFHEVTIPPGTVEGTHQHVGSEELYYIIEGNGIAYMGDGDDPNLSLDDKKHPLLNVDIFCLPKHDVRQVNVQPGSVIYTKSGGIHGIRNMDETNPLRFVAFGYHSA